MASRQLPPKSISLTMLICWRVSVVTVKADVAAHLTFLVLCGFRAFATFPQKILR